MCRLLLLTGTWRDEAAAARWHGFDLEWKAWVAPPERFKSNASHLVPLPDDAIALLEALPRFSKGDHVFSTSIGKVAVSGFSKARFDKLMAKEMGMRPSERRVFLVVRNCLRAQHRWRGRN